jgi:hypothetical protein
MLCSSYRPITLLNVVYRIFKILIHNRLSRIGEDKLEDRQMWFRTNRSTIDNLFIIRQIIEKCHEFNVELHNVFIDCTQAFDTVLRDKIFKCRNKYGVPSKPMKLIAKTLQDKSNIYWKIQNLNRSKRGWSPVSNPIQYSYRWYHKAAGIKGYYINTPETMRSIRWRYTNHRPNQTDIDWYFRKLKNISSQYGLIVNESKIKYIKCTRRENTLDKLQVGVTQIDQVK